MVLGFSLVTGTPCRISEQTIKNRHKLFYRHNYLTRIGAGMHFPQKIRHKKKRVTPVIRFLVFKLNIILNYFATFFAGNKGNTITAIKIATSNTTCMALFFI